MSEFIFGLLTTMATAATAFFAWQQQRQRVVIDWTIRSVGQLYKPTLFELGVTVRNYRRNSIEFWSVEVKGLPIVEVTIPDRRKSIDPSWSTNCISLSGGAAPGESSYFAVIVEPDWLTLQRVMKRQRKRRWRLIIRWTDRSCWLQRKRKVIHVTIRRGEVLRWSEGHTEG